MNAQKLAYNERILPPHAPGMRIGLFGGTFDPPHQAHLDASLLAMKRLNLDRVWWLVTPGNPLKNTSGLAPLNNRIAAARVLIHHPRIDVTGLEAVINTRYSYDTILWLLARCPRVQFVWIMGADNLRHFHRWQKWRGIAELIPMVVVDRPGPSLYAAASPAGQALARFRISEIAAASLPGRHAPVWTFLHGLKSALSSTALRALRSQSGTSNKDAKTGASAGKVKKTAATVKNLKATKDKRSQRQTTKNRPAKSKSTTKTAKAAKRGRGRKRKGGKRKGGKRKGGKTRAK